MTESSTTIRTGRNVLIATVAALLALTTVGAPATAQSFLDPADPCPPGVEVEPAPFTDRSSIRETHLLNVDCLAALEVALGWPSGEFRPDASTQRDQMASFIVRSLEAAGYDLPAASDQGFTDVPDGNTHSDNINILAQIGVTKGRTATTFTPTAPVRRDQMASFILRAAEFAFDDEGGLNATQPNPFEDVPASNVHADNIAAASELLGLTVGTSETTFTPQRPTLRGEMATFLVRLIDITLRVN